MDWGVVVEGEEVEELEVRRIGRRGSGEGIEGRKVRDAIFPGYFRVHCWRGEWGSGGVGRVESWKVSG